MNQVAIVRPAAVAFVTFLSLAARPATQAPPATRGPLTASAVAGSWVATLSHAGETRAFGVTLDTIDDHTVAVKMTNPMLHIDDLPIGKATIEGTAVTLEPGFALQYDGTADTLHCTLPSDLVPLYAIAATFHRGHVPPQPARALGGALATPRWTFSAGAPISPGPRHRRQPQLRSARARRGQRRAGVDALHLVLVDRVAGHDS